MSNVKMKEDVDPVVAPVEEKEIGSLEALWSFFSSMKTAIVLLLLLAAASIAGTVIEDKMGKSIYGSTWYSMLLLLVGINLAVCSVNRLGMVWRRTFHPKVAVTPADVATMTRCETLPCNDAPGTAMDKVVRGLRARSYRSVTLSDGEGVSIYADKGRPGLWGPHLTHLSLLVIFAGAIFGNMTGSEGFTTIMEGRRAETYVRKEKQDKPGAATDKKVPLGFQVALRSFTIKYDKNHNPVGYKSDLQVYDGGQPKLQRVVDVNHPLSYKGLSFYQSDYGLVGLMMKVTAPDGSVARIPYNINTQDTPDGRVYELADQPFQSFRLGGKDLTIFVHNLVPDYVGGNRVNGSLLPLNPAVNVMLSDRFPKYKGLDAWGQLGWMTANKPAAYKGYSVSLEKVVSYTGLQVSRNPGLPIVYLGFALMVLGVILSFYVTHKVIRVRIAPGRGGGLLVMMGATSRAEPTVFDKDYKRVRDALA